jgi:iron complex outermembrane receptor protein
LPSGASAIYGSDAIGGVVNYVLRDPKQAGQTLVHEGMVTSGSLRQTLVSQGAYVNWGSGNASATFEYRDDTPLPASNRSFETSNLTAEHGPNWDTVESNPGNIQVGSTTWAIPRGQSGPLTPSEVKANSTNLENLYDNANLLPRQKQMSVVATTTQDLGSMCSLSFEGLFTHRDTVEQSAGEGGTFSVPSANPFYFNPTGGTAAVTVDYNFGRDLGPQINSAVVNDAIAALTFKITLSDSSQLTFYLNQAIDAERQDSGGKVNFAALNEWLASSVPTSAFNAFRDGSFTGSATLAAISEHPWFDSTSQLSSLGVKYEGDLGELPGGTLRAVLGGEYRHQTLETDWAPDIGTPDTADRYDRRLRATFAQAKIPIFGKDQAYTALYGLQLSVAGRLEENNDFGRTFVPLAQVEWMPIEFLRFGASFGRSYKAPNLTALNESTNTSLIVPLANPNQNNQTEHFLIASGSNRSLSAERSTTRTFQAGFGVPLFTDMKVALEATYFNTEFTGLIQSQPFSVSLLSDPLYSSFIIRNPARAFRDEICTTGQFYGTLADCEGSSIAGIIDLRLHNTGGLFTQGIDLHSSFEWNGERDGHLVWDLYGTYLLDYSEMLVPGARSFHLLNTVGSPINTKLRSSLRWESHAWAAALTAHYQNSYRNTLVSPAEPVASWTTFDLHAVYHLPKSAGTFFGNIDVSAGVQNVLNRNPPYVANPTTESGWDQTNAAPFNRVFSVDLSIRW